MRLRASFLLLFAIGCTAPPVSPPPVAEPAPAEPIAKAEEPSHEPAVATSKPDVGAIAPADETLLEIRAEWDAIPGPDPIALRGDGRLTAAAEEGRASLPTSGGYFFDEQARIEVVQLGHPKYARAIVVAIPTGDEEDPANVYQLFVSDGGALKKVWEATVGSYGVVPLTFAGDGTVRYLEDGWTACERAKFPAKVKLQTVVLAIGKDGMLGEVKRQATKQTQDCGMLAACPFVYVVGDGEPVRVGEILRNLRGAAAYGEQSLALPLPHDGSLRVRIAEEKHEVTRLDAIAIVVDGVEVLPRACGSGEALSYCEADRSYAVLRRGDVLELEFAVPRGAESIDLLAAGYYAIPR
jgi:hypothetical protein